MKIHEANEKNQIQELSQEEMRQILGGRCGVEDPVSQTSYEVPCPRPTKIDKLQDEDIPQG